MRFRKASHEDMSWGASLRNQNKYGTYDSYMDKVDNHNAHSNSPVMMQQQQYHPQDHQQQDKHVRKLSRGF